MDADPLAAMLDEYGAESLVADAPPPPPAPVIMDDPRPPTKDLPPIPLVAVEETFEIERANDIAASENHAALPEDEVPSTPVSSIAVPTLVIHGTADPLFPLEHGQVLAEEIPGARLLTLEGAGHGVDRADRETLVRAIVEHTSTRATIFGGARGRLRVRGQD